MSDEDTTTPAAVTDPPVPPAEPPAPAEAPQEETVTMTAAEAAALRRRVAEAEKEKRKVEADRKKADEDRQAEQGQYKELAEQRERELAQAREQSARAERDQRITQIASRLKFIDPADVVGRVTAEDGADDSLAEAALERIAAASPHLVVKEAPARPEIGQIHAPEGAATAGQPGGKPAPPAGRAPLMSMADVDSLTQAEMVVRMPEIDWLLEQEQQKK